MIILDSRGPRVGVCGSRVSGNVRYNTVEVRMIMYFKILCGWLRVLRVAGAVAASRVAMVLYHTIILWYTIPTMLSLEEWLAPLALAHVLHYGFGVNVLAN